MLTCIYLEIMTLKKFSRTILSNFVIYFKIVLRTDNFKVRLQQADYC